MNSEMKTGYSLLNPSLISPERVFLTRVHDSSSVHPRFHLWWFTPVAESAPKQISPGFILVELGRSVDVIWDAYLQIDGSLKLKKGKAAYRWTLKAASNNCTFDYNAGSLQAISSFHAEAFACLQGLCAAISWNIERIKVITDSLELVQILGDHRKIPIQSHWVLAAAHFCFSSGLVKWNTIEYSTLSGILNAKKVFEPKEPSSVRNGNCNTEEQFFIQLDFPSVAVSDYRGLNYSSISKVLGNTSLIDVKNTVSDDIFFSKVVLPSVNDITNYQPNYEEIQKLPGRGLIRSAAAPPESVFDFFDRFFCPKMGINEYPVCGSAHCALVSYRSKKLEKCDFLAYAASPRSGILKLHLNEQSNRVKLQGQAITVMEGSILV